MSLAASGGGFAGAGGGGGLVMAHSAGGNAAAIAKAPPPPNAGPAGSSPPSAAVLGSELMDKAQGLSLKRVKNTSHLPIVALDIHGAQLAYFPKKPEDPSKGTLPIAVDSKDRLFDVCFTTGEVAHKTLRKFLAKSRTFASLQTDSLATSSYVEKSGRSIAELPQPHLWLGYRRVESVPEKLRNQIPGNKMVSVANSTLDGTEPTASDNDRVVFKVSLTDGKKPVTILPEEAVEIVVCQAQYHVASALDNETFDDDSIIDFPVALALPAYASNDAAVEALLEAVPGAVVVQRNVALLAGALLPDTGDALLQRLATVRKALQQQHLKQLATDPGAVLEDECLLIVVSSAASGGVECTAVQVFSPNTANVACLMGELRVIANVSMPGNPTAELVQECVTKLETILESHDVDGPTGIVWSTPIQKKNITTKEWQDVPVFPASPSVVAKGTAVLGAVSHGRLSRLVHIDCGGKPRAVLGIHVQNVAPMAVAIQHKYTTGDDWDPPKVLFDFDRQTPAGPYTIDYEAAECVVYGQKNASELSEEEFLQQVTQHEGHSGIPQREQAALNLTVRILQKYTRDGEWQVVGEPWQPLTKEEEQDGDEKKKKKIAIERVQVMITLSVTGLISTQHVGDGQSVAAATKSARNSAILTYSGITFAVLFMGYFMFKSYYDEYVLDRDTARLLAYYKHTVPGSFNDGDEHAARYTCYKYRHKKEKLWINLERKYGEPVLTTAEYDVLFREAAEQVGVGQDEEEEEETVDLDEDEKAKEEPDL